MPKEWHIANTEDCVKGDKPTRPILSAKGKPKRDKIQNETNSEHVVINGPVPRTIKKSPEVTRDSIEHQKQKREFYSDRAFGALYDDGHAWFDV